MCNRDAARVTGNHRSAPIGVTRSYTPGATPLWTQFATASGRAQLGGIDRSRRLDLKDLETIPGLFTSTFDPNQTYFRYAICQYRAVNLLYQLAPYEGLP